MSSFSTIRQVFYGIVVIAGAMTIFMYNWLDKYFEQKQKIQLAAIQAFEQNIGHAVNIYDDYAMELEDKKSDLSPDDYEVPKPVDIDTEDMLEPIIEKNDVSLEEVVNSEDADQLAIPEMNELPWEKIKEMNEQKKSELTFEKEPEVIPDEKPFWEVDDYPGSPEVKKEMKKSDDMSWEEPENIIHDTDQGPPPVYNTTALAKLVHLDFKGAPLKMYFIEKFLQNITTWGGTGLLMEYEDTFPFSDRFSILRGKFTYTEDFIKKLNSQAKQNNLEVIPYISLFDDLGFLLKHPEFKKYRDNSKYTELINPLHDDSVNLLTDIVGDILRLHPEARMIHIGCRRPMMLGWSLLSKQWMHRHQKNLDGLYLDFVTRLIESIKSKFKVNIIIWGNFILNMPFHIITDSGIHRMTQLMLESYKALNLEFDDSSLVDLGKIFPSVWLAGSFKGTIDSTKSISGMIDHARNINELLTLSKNLVRQRVQYKGISLMGYSRQNHYSSLTELLPMAVPTLVCCLQALKTGELSTITEWNTAKIIGIKTDQIPEVAWPRPLPVVGGTFPGSKISIEIQKLENTIYEANRLLEDNQNRIYMNSYATESDLSLIPELKTFSGKLGFEIGKLEKARSSIQDALGEVFYGDTIDEFLEEHVDFYLRRLQTSSANIKSLITIK